jgi:hypothetical protein
MAVHQGAGLDCAALRRDHAFGVGDLAAQGRLSKDRLLVLMTGVNVALVVLGFLLTPAGFSWFRLGAGAESVARWPARGHAAYVPLLPTAWCTVTFMPGAPMQSRWQRFKLWLAKRISNRKY